MNEEKVLEKTIEEPNQKNNKGVKVKKINGKRIVALVLSGFVLAGTLSYCSKKEEKTLDELIGYEDFIDDEYTEIDLTTISFFDKLKTFKDYILTNYGSSEFFFGSDYEIESVCTSVYNLLFYGFDIDTIINGYTKVDESTGENYKFTGGFSEYMRDNIYYSGDTNIKFSDLSKKGQYIIIQMARDITYDLHENFESLNEYNSCKSFLENGEKLLLVEDSSISDKFLTKEYLGKNPTTSDYHRYYSYKLGKIEVTDTVKNDFDEALQMIEDAKDKVSDWLDEKTK